MVKTAPTMSSPSLGDFGPLTERRRAEYARKQRGRIMIAAGTVSIIIILIVMGSAAVMYSGKKSSSDGGGGHKSSSKGSSSPAKGKSSGGSDSDSESGLEDGSEGRVQEHQGDVLADRLHGRVREEPWQGR